MLTSNKTLVLAAGSPSTVIAVALFLRASGLRINPKEKNVQIIFTQAFLVGENSAAIKAVQELPEDAVVFIVGLPVNNKAPEMTLELFRAIGNRLGGVYDEHQPEAWQSLREHLDLPAEIFHTPGRNETPSAASIVRACFPSANLPELWVEAADWADNRSLVVSAEAETLGAAIDCAIKGRIADNQFRFDVVNFLLGEPTATARFLKRYSEALVVEGRSKEAVEKALEDPGLNGHVLTFKHSADKHINVTAAMFYAYEFASFAMAVGPKAGESGDVLMIGCSPKQRDADNLKINLLQLFADLGASGQESNITISSAYDLEEIVRRLNAIASQK